MRVLSTLATLALASLACTDRSIVTAPGMPTVPDVAGSHTMAAPPAVALLPDAGDRMLFDTRASLQSASSLERALDAWNASFDDDGHVKLRLAENVDGAGTNALRFEWQGQPKGCREVSPSVGVTVPRPYPTRLYVRWTQHIGRTATGGGVGDVGQFAIPLNRCDGLDGRFIWMVSREETGGEQRRVDLRWRGADVPRPAVNVKRTGVLIHPNQGWDFLPADHAGQTIVQTLYVQAESRPNAGDGAIRLWVDDVLLLEQTGLSIGAEAFRRMNFPWTMAAPARSQTEYFWDMLSWVSPISSLTLGDVPEGPLVVGAGASLRARAFDRHGADVTGFADVAWSSSDEDVVRVSATGAVTAVGPGEALITASTNGHRAEARLLVVRAGFYASPTGAADGDGSWRRPWDLATAVAGAGGALVPGSTLWLRGGEYHGDFRSVLTGTESERIVVRQYPGERATIEGRLRADGAYTDYWGFEIRQDVARHAYVKDWPALEAYGANTRYINLVIHDAGENGISFRTEAGRNEVHGAIVYNNGDDEGLDQGIYAPNDGGEKWITDNVFFTNLASGIQVFADDSHPNGISNVHVVGNVSFNNSYIANRPGEENVTVGGDVRNQGLEVASNVLYFSRPVGRNLRVGLEPGIGKPRLNVSVAVRDNYVAGGETILRMQHWQQAEVRGNTLVGLDADYIVRLGSYVTGYTWEDNVLHAGIASQWRHDNPVTGKSSKTLTQWIASTGFDPARTRDRVVAAAPTETRVFVRPNRYEHGRAHVAVVNWGAAAAVAVDVGGVLDPGERYQVHNVQDLWGAPVASGVFTGAPITLPLGGVAPPRPARGGMAAPMTGPFFDAFVITLADPRRVR